MFAAFCFGSMISRNKIEIPKRCNEIRYDANTRDVTACERGRFA